MLQTNDINVAKLELAYELCKNVTIIENRAITPLTKDEGIIERAKLIRKVVSALTKPPGQS